MTRVGFRKQGGLSEEVSRAQSNTETSIAPVLRSEIVNGTLVENISLTSVPSQVEHKLGRKIRGYLVCRNNNGANVFNSGASINPNLFENLAATSNCVVSIWFF